MLAAPSNDDADLQHRKLSLSFILSGGDREQKHTPLPSLFRREPEMPAAPQRMLPPLQTYAYTAPMMKTDASIPAQPTPFIARPQTLQPMQQRKKTYDEMTKDEKRKARACRIEGCDSYIINRGLCFRHGGGKRCATPGCESSAKNLGFCWKHGGSTSCIIEGCTRRGKARGLCWAHGGGTKCSEAGCSTIAVSNSKCWAHGGGKRCVYTGCTRAAYERTHNYCTKHLESVGVDTQPH